MIPEQHRWLQILPSRDFMKCSHEHPWCCLQEICAYLSLDLYFHFRLLCRGAQWPSLFNHLENRLTQEVLPYFVLSVWWFCSFGSWTQGFSLVSLILFYFWRCGLANLFYYLDLQSPCLSLLACQDYKCVLPHLKMLCPFILYTHPHQQSPSKQLQLIIFTCAHPSECAQCTTAWCVDL